MPTTRYCRFCGNALRSPDARFCSACGRDLVAGASPTAEQQSPCLMLRIPGRLPREIPLVDPVLTLGRDPDNRIVVPVSYVSAHHGRFERRGDVWTYTDRSSTNGTYVNGRLVTSADLHAGDVLRIGDPHGNSVGLNFRCPSEDAIPHGPGMIELGMELLGKTGSITIGRDPASTIHLPGVVVSWSHARIDTVAERRVLVDLNSTNGTFVNGARVGGSQFLREGDVIQVGPFKLVYQATGLQQYAEVGGVRLDGVRIVREVGSGGGAKRILDDISLSVLPREFIAVVGTSGAGKSTLLKALSGVAKAQGGQVLVNGDNLYQHFDLYRTMIGYLPQDDILHRDLKVADALRYSAKLRLPPDTSSAEIERRIDKVLEDVEMVAQKKQVINSLSGGQRKRVSIAAELLAEPRLFFLDEPTSGLDPGLEKKMMYTLRRLADAGRTIVLVTHATANITQCDHVCFLSQGRMAYYGPPEETFAFFGVTSHDFADVYDKLDNIDPKVARRQAESWRRQYHQSELHQTYVAHRQRTLPKPASAGLYGAARARPRVNPLRQLAVLTRRYCDLVMRDRLLLTVLMVIMPLIGALVLLVSSSNWLVGNSLEEIHRQLAIDLIADGKSATYSVVGESQTLLFMMALASVLLGLFASVYEIVKEWSIYQRERMVTLRILPYLGSKVIVMGLFSLLQSLFFLIVIGLRVDYPAAGVLLPATVEIYITLVLGTMAAMLMGLLISAIVPNANTVIYLVFLTLMFQMIFGGVLFDLPGLSQGVSGLTLTRWSMEALGASTNVERLNQLTRTRFQPDTVVEEFSTEVEKPSEDWEPVTVITTTQEITVPIQPGVVQTVPISVPQITENEMITVTELLTESVTVVPEPMDVISEIAFRISYRRSLSHLLGSWAMLGFSGLMFGVATAVALKRKDVM
jgi:ABC transport system ATP-binding/permease protein